LAAGWAMPRGAQAKLPATMPTPAEARSALRLAKADVAEKRGTVAKQRLDIKTAQGQIERCAAVLEEVEADLLGADEGSPEDLRAAALEVEAVRAFDVAERAHETLTKALPYLVAECKQAEGRLRAARGDIRAIGEGRRK